MNYINTAPSSIKEASRKDDFGFPPQGFFVVKCLGKNKIIVGGKTVSKGQVAILTDKVTLQLASYKLYFLLPLHNDENDQNPSILEKLKQCVRGPSNLTLVLAPLYMRKMNFQ